MWNIFSNQLIAKGGYKLILTGLVSTLEIAIAGLLIGFVLGAILAFIKVAPKYKRGIRILSRIADVYIALFRGTPIVVQLLIGYFVIAPLLGGLVNGTAVSIAVFGLNSGAYMSEMIRGGILSVDSGQLEAGRALGLTFTQAMLKIVLPQSVKNILPSLGNEFISLIKETSVVSFIAVVDLTKAYKTMADATYEYIVPYLMLALTYLILVMIVTFIMNGIERRFKKNER